MGVVILKSHLSCIDAGYDEPSRQPEPHTQIIRIEQIVPHEVEIVLGDEVGPRGQRSNREEHKHLKEVWATTCIHIHYEGNRDHQYNSMGNLVALKIDYPPAAVDRDVGGQGEPEDDVDEDWEEEACCEPGEVSGVREQVALLVLLVDVWKERVDEWL